MAHTNYLFVIQGGRRFAAKEDDLVWVREPDDACVQQVTLKHFSVKSPKACVKKGLTPEKCNLGCRSCRQTRLICDGGRPYSTCRDATQECIHIEAANPSSYMIFAAENALVEANVTFVSRPAERAKVACLACRRLRVLDSFERASVVADY